MDEEHSDIVDTQGWCIVDERMSGVDGKVTWAPGWTWTIIVEDASLTETDALLLLSKVHSM